jgi:hypothetical protein
MLAATLRYAAFAVLALVGPGLAVHRVLRVPVQPAAVLPLGLAAAAAAQWLSLSTGQAWLFSAMIALLDLALLLPGPPWRLAPGPSLRGAIAPFLVTTSVLAVTQFPWNRTAASGEFLLDPLVPYDTGFHVGLTRELTFGTPPQVPGVSGFPLGYHLGIDLVRAAALRWAAVDPYDSISRFDVTLGALALILALRAATQAAGGSPRAVTLVGFTPLLTDFSWLFALAPEAHWWADLLRGNVLLSLIVSSPTVPALALALGCVAALAREEPESQGWRALAIAAVLGAAVPFFKVFLGAHLALGLAAAAVLSPTRRRACLAVLAPLTVCTAALVLGQGGRTVEVALRPLDLVRATRASLDLEAQGGWPLVAFALFWLVASLGIRVLGLGQAVRSLRDGPVAAQALAAIALSGWPLGLLFRVGAPEMLPGQSPVNDAAFLVEQAGAVLWVFAALALVRLPRGAVAVLVALALPATAQLVVKKATAAPDPLPASMVRAMRALEADSRPGDVVLQRPGARYPPAPVILIGRRVPYERFTPWLTQFASRSQLEERHQTVFRFFRTTDAEEARAIASALNARYVALYGGDRLRFPTVGFLVPVHEEPEARVYRLP